MNGAAFSGVSTISGDVGSKSRTSLKQRQPLPCHVQIAIEAKYVIPGLQDSTPGSQLRFLHQVLHHELGLMNG